MSRYIFSIIFLSIFCCQAISQDSLVMNKFNKYDKKEGMWRESEVSKKLSTSESFQIICVGNYRNGVKVGLWEYEVWYSDFNNKFAVEYLPDNGIIVFQDSAYSVGRIIVSKDSSIFKITNDNGFKITRWCEKGNDNYKCYEYSYRLNVINECKKYDILNALDYITFSNYGLNLLKYFLNDSMDK